MMVSVIIPAFNSETTIVDTLNSVFEQTYKPIEIIVVNDGSTDDTLKLLNSYGDKIKIITTENKGVSHARKLGLKSAAGFYIQYLDSDDLLMPTKIEIQVKAIELNKADVAYGNWQKFEEIEGRIVIKEEVTRELVGDPEVAIFTSFWCPPAALLYSRNITSRIDWNENLPIIQDARYLLDSAIAKGKFVYTDVFVAKYRANQLNSLSNRSRDRFITDCFFNAKSIYELWFDGKISDQKRLALIEVLSSLLPSLLKYDKNAFLTCCSYLKSLSAESSIYKNRLKRLMAKLVGIRKTEEIVYHYRKLVN